MKRPSKPRPALPKPLAAKPRCGWSLEEDALLVALLNVMGNVPWKQIAEHVPRRDGATCRDRFNRSLKNSPRWRDHIGDNVRLARGPAHRNRARGSAPPLSPPLSPPALAVGEKDEECEMLYDALDQGCPFSIEDGDTPLDFGVSDELASASTFEDICNLGALPHLSQPVPYAVPSPNTLAALPLMMPAAPDEQPRATAPAGRARFTEPVAAVAPSNSARPVRPVMVTRIVPSEHISKESRIARTCNTTAIAINPLLTSALPWKPFAFQSIPLNLGMKFSKLNKLLNTPPVKPARRYRTTSVEFNFDLVAVS